MLFSQKWIVNSSQKTFSNAFLPKVCPLWILSWRVFTLIIFFILCFRFFFFLEGNSSRAVTTFLYRVNIIINKIFINILFQLHNNHYRKTIIFFNIIIVSSITWIELLKLIWFWFLFFLIFWFVSIEYNILSIILCLCVVIIMEHNYCWWWSRQISSTFFYFDNFVTLWDLFFSILIWSQIS